MNDPIQARLVDLITNGLPANSSEDPEIHPDLNGGSQGAGAGTSPQVVLMAGASPFVSRTVKYRHWEARSGGCGCKRAAAKTEVKLLSMTTSGELSLDASVRVLKGPGIQVKEGRCRLRRQNWSADTTVSTWSYCDWLNTLGYPTMTINIPTDMKRFGGIRNESYHNDIHLRIDPAGVKYEAKDFSFRGATFKYDANGQDPVF